MSDEVRRRRGRPSEGERVSVRLPSHVIEVLDQRAARKHTSRAQEIRTIIAGAINVEADGVDRAQIRRMLRLTPAQRLQHMTEVANALVPLKGVARRR